MTDKRISKQLCIFIIIICASFAALAVVPLSIATAAEPAKWTGVDEAVIEKIAKEHGREAVAPIIDKEQGDLLLFLFLVAGAGGGFAAGYYWRVIVSEKSLKTKTDKEIKTTG
jgi:hypothetical protein